MNSKAKAWIGAFRLRTLPLAFSCILMGTFLAAGDGYFDGWILALSLLTTLFLQVLSNLANDYGDAVSGVDGLHRSGPGRTVSSGLLSSGEMKRALYFFAGLALISGVGLIWLAFGDNWVQVVVFFLLGLGSIAAAIKYTVGKNPYGYAGWGDVFVLLFFGIVGVGGTYYLFVSEFNFLIILPALSCGLLAVGVLNVNNIRDIESDKAAGKYSIPVRLGRKRAIIYHWLLLLLAVGCTVIFLIIESAGWLEYLFLLTLPLLGVNARAVRAKDTAEQLDPYLRQLAFTTLFFVLLFGLGQVAF